MRYLVLALALLTLTFGVVVADSHLGNFVPQVCATREGCFEGISVAECTTRNGEFVPADDSRCEIVCCSYNGNFENMASISCESLSGSQTDQTSCDEAPETNVCEQGETNCRCGITDIISGQYCCDGSVSDESCSDASNPSNPGETTCGNGVLEGVEQCEVDGIFSDACVDDPQQSCTSLCRCSIQPDDYEPEDPYCSPGEPCEDQGRCELELVSPTCEDGAPCVDAIMGFDQARITWQFSDESCVESVDEISIHIRDSLGELVDSVSSSARSYQFSVKSDTAYQIRVGALYNTEQLLWSEYADFTSGNEECFTQRRAFCLEAEIPTHIQYCDANNMLSSTYDCSAESSQCLQTETSAVCVPAVSCSVCDASYSALGELDEVRSRDLFYEGEELDYNCEDLTTLYQWGDEPAQACYLGYTQTALKQHVQCSAVNSCSQYYDEDNCVQDVCFASGTCIWNSDEHLCTAQEEEEQTCDASEKEACAAQGSACVFVDDTCERKDALSCRDYETKQACGVSPGFVLNEDTNLPISLSSDEFGFGKCRWLSNRCQKDSNYDDVPEPRTDTDFENPITTLIGNPGSRVWPKEIEIQFAVSGKQGGKTFAELSQNEDNCDLNKRPQSSFAVDQSGLMKFSRESGTYCLRYYSRDSSMNLEEVHQVPIIVDTRQLEVTEFVAQTFTQSNTSNVYLKAQLNKPATCSLYLADPDNTPILPRRNAVFGQGFDVFLHDLLDGIYTAYLTCESAQSGSVSSELIIQLDTDAVIQKAYPINGTYASGPEIGVFTAEQAQCEYNDGAWKEFSNSRSRTINGEQLFEHYSKFSTQEQGLYELPVRCQIGSDRIDGGEADIIIFAVDTLAPRMNVTLDGVTLMAGDTTLAEVVDTIDIFCEDEPIIGRGKNWESGCVSVLVKKDGEEQEALRVPAKNFAVEQGELWRIGGRDAVGRTSIIRQYRFVDEDITGPERPIFEVQS